MNKLFSTLAAILISLTMISQEQTNDLYEMDLSELMDMEITVASAKAMTPRESPGIVSIITKEEIQNSGARDLIDVLRLIPGIDFGVDVQGAVGVIMRGNWGHDGKVLLIIDGQEMNELAYSTTQFGNHYSTNEIKRIEVIRGPGSSMYGGNAEYGVINIITEHGEDVNGVSATVTYGQMENNFGRQNINVSLGKKINDLEIALHGFYGKGNRSDQVFTDIFGDEFDFSEEGGELNPFFVNLGAKYKGFSSRFIYDNYNMKTSSMFDEGLSPAFDQSFASILGELRYDFKPMEKLTITPRINYKQQNPWTSTNDYFPYDNIATRIKGNFSSLYDVNDNLNITVGFEYYADNSTYQDDNLFYNDSDNFSYSNTSIFGQALLKTKLANLTIGGRYDNHSEIDPAFSPRIALTKAFEKMHFKLLYSHAFRSPGIENMNVAYKFINDTTFEFTAPKINPEKTVVTELELGYKISDKMLASVNIYNIEAEDPIMYFFYESAAGDVSEGYYNDSKTGSRGVEFDYRIKDKWGYANLNFSFYTTDGINEVVGLEVPDNENMLLASPQQKIALNTNFKVMKKLNISPSLIYRSQRYTYRSLDTNDIEVLSEEDPTILANIYFSYKDFLVKGLAIGAGVYDILGQKDEFFQPYNMWHVPLPGPSREILLRISYKFKFE